MHQARTGGSWRQAIDRADMTELAYPSGLTSGQGVISLSALVEHLQPRETHRFRELAIEGLAFHSGEVQQGNLFFAIPGTRADGATYAAQALARGADAVVAETPLALTCPVLVVDDARRALADAAAFYYRNPSHTVPVIGVTGTNGKTTVSHLIKQCLEADRRQVGMLGTIGYEFAGRRIPAITTTPDPIRIHGYLRDMADSWASTCVMEVSSHALDQNRVRGVKFASAVFLNLSQDHLDYHGSMRDYAAAKARLFRDLEPGATACLAADSRWCERMDAEIRRDVRVMRFGWSADADVRAENIDCRIEGTRFDLVMPNGRVEMFLPLPGRHNVQNALAAATAALSCGVSELTIAGALEDAQPVLGRLDPVENEGQGHGIRVFVDYAHTPDALEKVCGSLKVLSEGRLLVVFGCGGDRDRSKRPLMGQAVAKYADVVLLTADNPRSEDPDAILDEIEPGLARAEGECLRIVDREKAIHTAVHAAEPGDIVLIAGKGHETYQILRDSVVPFDDKLVAREALDARFHGDEPLGGR